MKVEVLVPEQGPTDLADLVAHVTRSEPVVAPFSDEVVELCAAISRELFRSSGTETIPEVQALAFFMRRAELKRLKDGYEHIARAEARSVPLGRVFQVPPSNVGTIFMYSWLFAALTGNSNIVRLSTNAVLADPMCAVINRVLRSDEFEALRPQTTIVRYGHEREATAALSALADARVIWGGDDAINLIREVPLPPHATELTFPDRASLSVIDATSYLALSASGQEKLVAAFYNDAYWFDQMGCSSPRLVAWRGDHSSFEEASQAFFGQLAEHVVEKQYRVDTGNALAKLQQGSEAILERAVNRYRSYGNELVVATLERLAQPLPDHPGGGFFYEARIDELADLADVVERRNQTLGHFGFRIDELRQLVDVLNGRGLERLVPIGQALQFDRYWDGYDLLRAFSRVVYVSDRAAVEG